MKENLGKKGRDKITGFEGTITVYAQHLYGCDSYVLTPRTKENKKESGECFDVGRIEILEQEVTAEEVADPSGKKGGEDISCLVE